MACYVQIFEMVVSIYIHIEINRCFFGNDSALIDFDIFTFFNIYAVANFAT